MSACGVDVAGSAAGLVSICLTAFRGCVQAFEIIHSATHFVSEADSFRCKLELEQYKLMQWAERIGLEKQPEQHLNWSLIADTLKQLQSLLSDTQSLKSKYCLELVQIESDTSEQETGASHNTSFSKLLDKLRPNSRLSSPRIIHNGNGVAKKLKWAAFDKEKAAKLVDDIVYFNHSLFSLLDSVNQEFLRSALASVLRDIIYRSNATSELEIIKQLLRSTYTATSEAVSSAATLKQIRLALSQGYDANRAEESASEPSPRNFIPKLCRLEPALLQRQSAESPVEGREIAHYKSSPVIIEWKLIDWSDQESQKELKLRVEQIAILLAHTDDASLHSLPCIGVLPSDEAYKPRDGKLICHGLVFGLTYLGPASALSWPVIQPLSSLYSEARKPSLNERRNIALALTEAVLQLHTSGWLHKGIRSDNVLFIGNGDSGWESGGTFGPYLAGYEYARPVNHRSEAVTAIPEHEIYQHPRGQGRGRENFRRSFDLFALGCVLLELSLWSNLVDILQRELSESTQNGCPGKEFKDLTVHSKGLAEVDWMRLHSTKKQLLQNDDPKKRGELANVAFHAGETFQKAILLCLYAAEDNRGDEDRGDGLGADEDMGDGDISVQKEVVDLLRQCRF
ncbi:MAG: hypothetical protein Q9225_001788 [Loekoesia sp. 1 TL-2023]